MATYKNIGMVVDRKMYDKFKAQCVQENVGVYAAIEQLIERETVLDGSELPIPTCCIDAYKQDFTFCPICGKRLKLDSTLWSY